MIDIDQLSQLREVVPSGSVGDGVECSGGEHRIWKSMQGGMQDAAAGKRRAFALQGGVSDVQRESRNDR